MNDRVFIGCVVGAAVLVLGISVPLILLRSAPTIHDNEAGQGARQSAQPLAPGVVRGDAEAQAGGQQPPSHPPSERRTTESVPTTLRDADWGSKVEAHYWWSGWRWWVNAYVLTVPLRSEAEALSLAEWLEGEIEVENPGVDVGQIKMKCFYAPDEWQAAVDDHRLTRGFRPRWAVSVNYHFHADNSYVTPHVAFTEDWSLAAVLDWWARDSLWRDSVLSADYTEPTGTVRMTFRLPDEGWAGLSEAIYSCFHDCAVPFHLSIDLKRAEVTFVNLRDERIAEIHCDRRAWLDYRLLAGEIRDWETKIYDLCYDANMDELTVAKELARAGVPDQSEALRSGAPGALFTASMLKWETALWAAAVDWFDVRYAAPSYAGWRAVDKHEIDRFRNPSLLLRLGQ